MNHIIFSIGPSNWATFTAGDKSSPIKANIVNVALPIFFSVSAATNFMSALATLLSPCKKIIHYPLASIIAPLESFSIHNSLAELIFGKMEGRGYSQEYLNFCNAAGCTTT